MKIGIYTPYLDTFGGGERYMLTIAETLLPKEQVELLVDSHLISLKPEELLDKAVERFNLKLNNLKIIKAPLGSRSSFLQKIGFFKTYDVIFFLTDGSLFYSTAKKSFLHIQSPLVGQPAKNPLGKLKLSSWSTIIYNSQFTKKNAERNWPLKSVVVYPPVDVSNIKPLRKEKIILTVGRFFGYLKDKKQDVLIDVFKKLHATDQINGWSLHLAGSAGEGDQEYIEQLKSQAKGFPIEFHPNLEYSKLIELYGKASIYWHAMGYQVDDPTKMEHFGISTVEAMAGGAVPVVIKKGGQLEIVEEEVSGLLWNNLDELHDLTLALIRDLTKLSKLSKNAIRRAKLFSKEEFQKQILKLVLEK